MQKDKVKEIIQKYHDDKNYLNIQEVLKSTPDVISESDINLLDQNKQLKDLNTKLVNQMLSKQNHNRQKSPSQWENQYLNLSKLNQNYKRQIKLLKLKLHNTSNQKIEELQLVVIHKQREIQVLKNQLKGIKRIQKNQEKALIEVAGDGVIKCFKNYQLVNQQLKKSQAKCKTYQRELRRKSLQKKTIDSTQTKEQNYEKLIHELEFYKQVDARNKKQLSELRRQNQQLKQQIEVLTHQIKNLTNQLDKTQKNQNIKRLIPSINESKYSVRQSPSDYKQKVKTMIFDNHSQDLYKKMKYYKQYGQFDKKSRYSSKRYVKLNKEYLKTQQLQQQINSHTNNIQWNDIEYSSKIIQIHIEVNQNNCITGIHAKYEKGESESNLKNPLKFICQRNEFIQYISGAFYQNLLSQLILTTNHNRQIKIGKQQNQSIKFDFSIKNNEFPCSLFGELSRTKQNQYRIIKLGCTIDKL